VGGGRARSTHTCQAPFDGIVGSLAGREQGMSELDGRPVCRMQYWKGERLGDRKRAMRLPAGGDSRAMPAEDRERIGAPDEPRITRPPDIPRAVRSAAIGDSDDVFISTTSHRGV
jgi:hypothetical protein